MTEVEAYIRAGAIARGIDPDVAVRIAQTEGGLNDPYRMSQVKTGEGKTEDSVGPFQLYFGGGLGNAALAAGVDPKKDWKGGVDFALDTAARKKSWADWHGARDNNIPNDAGFTDKSRAIGLSLTSNPVSTTGTSPVTTTYSSGAPAPVAATEGGAAEPEEQPKTWDEKVAALAKEDGGLDLIAKSMAAQRSAQAEAIAANSQITPSSMGGMGANDAAMKASAQALMAQLMQPRRKRTGLSLMG
jgi:hypothetical protein